MYGFLSVAYTFIFSTCEVTLLIDGGWALHATSLYAWFWWQACSVKSIRDGEIVHCTVVGRCYSRAFHNVWFAQRKPKLV